MALPQGREKILHALPPQGLPITIRSMRSRNFPHPAYRPSYRPIIYAITQAELNERLFCFSGHLNEINKLFEKYGQYVRFWLGPDLNVCVKNPADIKVGEYLQFNILCVFRYILFSFH